MAAIRTQVNIGYYNDVNIPFLLLHYYFTLVNLSGELNTESLFKNNLTTKSWMKKCNFFMWNGFVVELITLST